MTTRNTDPLEEYRGKRDFTKTGEPAGRDAAGGEGRLFVIQKHQATRLHYDFRLEADGVLKSWAVPKGPSVNPRDKRLAVPTEDHPIEYADFEGAIPEGEYGGGAVLVWDTGTYENITEKGGKIIPAGEAIAAGHLLVRLRGKKLKGGFAFTRTGRDPRGRERWILVKMRDDDADDGDVVSERPESVLTGRTIEQVAAGGAS